MRYIASVAAAVRCIRGEKITEPTSAEPASGRTRM
jgi:hypothetical protein